MKPGDNGTLSNSQVKSLGLTVGSYEFAFGNLPNKTVYSSPDLKGMFKTDMREELKSALSIGMKALNTEAGGAGTAGFALVPVFVDPVIVDRSRKETPLTELIPRVTNQGMTADFNVITAKGGGFTAAEDAALNEQDNTYDRASTAIKFLYAVGRVTGPAQASNPPYMLAGMNPTGFQAGFTDASGPNAIQREIVVQSRALKELEENLIINGNATTSGIAGNPNGTEYDGIIAIQSTTNKVDKNTTALSLNDLTRAIRLAFDDGGRPNLGVSSSSVFEDIQNLLLEKNVLQPLVTAEWGYTFINLTTMTGQVQVIPSMFMSNTSGSKAIYFLDLSVWEMRVLQDMTFERIGKENDSDKFFLKIYETLICRATGFNAWVGEIA